MRINKRVQARKKTQINKKDLRLNQGITITAQIIQTTIHKINHKQIKIQTKTTTETTEEKTLLL